MLSKLRWERGRCCAVHCQKEQNHHQQDATEQREYFCRSATTNRTQWERRRGTQVSLKNKNNHMKHTGRGVSVSSSPLDPSPAPREQLHCCLPRQIRATMVPLWTELWHFSGSLGVPLPVGHYQEIELQWLCRRGSWFTPAFQDPCRQAAFPLGRLLVILSSIPCPLQRLQALGGQLKQHDRSYLPISHLQSDDMMLGEGSWGFFLCVIVFSRAKAEGKLWKGELHLNVLMSPEPRFLCSLFF